MTAVADVLFIAVILALFGVAWLLVRGCEKIIGAEEVTELRVEPETVPADDEVMA
jgi:hypothetical protein